jgi:acyl transferase domain-containing protein
MASPLQVVAPIAIVGMGCRMPGGVDSPQALWQLLSEGVDATCDVPPGRWDVARLYDPQGGMAGRMSTRRGGFLDRVDLFDAEFFGISPVETKSMDPQQRLMLEVAWEALENAHIVPSQLAGSATGVFVGLNNYDYSRLVGFDYAKAGAYYMTGTSQAIVANRISYVLDLRGPSISIDTACSSSLVSLHLACQALRAGECGLAIAGGVHLMLSPISTISFSAARMMAPDGRSKAFSSTADGYGRSEGAGAVVLRRLDDAVANGDDILAVIRGSAVNQDGMSNGLTAPNGPAQEAVIATALRSAGICPDQISYVEAHGSGTPLGDLIEFNALKNVLGVTGSRHPCAIGALKSNVGHLEAAAGVAGLIKVVLALKHRALTPNLHNETPNPRLDMKSTRFWFPNAATPWETDTRRVAGVSSFGFGGTNAHVIVEEAPDRQQHWFGDLQVERHRSEHVLALSAKTEAALTELVNRYAERMDDGHDSIEDVCFSANTTRSRFEHRLCIGATSRKELLACLHDAQAGRSHPRIVRGRSKADVHRTGVAFLFTGQGAEAVGMAHQLYETNPVFRNTLQTCLGIAERQQGRSLLALLYPTPEQEGQARLAIRQPSNAHPLLYALQISLAELHKSWGVQPRAVMGHGIGEYVAACVAGVFSVEDGMRLVIESTRSMDAMPDQFGADSARITYHRPKIAMISSHAGRLASDEVCSASYWQRRTGASADVRACMRALFDKGLRIFVEIGPTPALLDLGKACADERAQAMTWLPTLDGSANDWSVINRALGELFVRGFDIDWRGYDACYPRQRVELPLYPFQRQRYWIDDAKSADAGPAAGSSAGQYSVVWREAAALQNSSPAARGLGCRWLIVTDARDSGERLAHALTNAGQVARVVYLERAGDDEPVADGWNTDVDIALATAVPSDLEGIVCLFGSPSRPDGANRDAIPPSSLKTLLAVVQGLLLPPPVTGHRPVLHVITTAARAVLSADKVDAAQATLWGLGRVFANEAPQSWGSMWDLAEALHPPQAGLIARVLTSEAATGEELALRAGRLYAARLARLPVPLPDDDVRFSGAATYLITGASGGLGQAVTKWMVAHGARNLVWVNRRRPDASAQRLLAQLSTQGANVRVFEADIGQPGVVADIVAQLKRESLPIRGVLHAAGVLDDGLLSHQNWERFEAVLAPKARGARFLHDATSELALEFFVLFSSASSILGPPGQASYASANAYLDALAQERRGEGLPALSINWGPWADVGMAASLAPGHTTRLREHGVQALSVADGLAHLGRLLRADLPHAMVLDIDWQRYLEPKNGERRMPLFEAFRQSPTPTGAPPKDPSPLRSELRHVDVSQRAVVVSRHVHEQVCQVLGFDSGQPLSPTDLFFDMGLDSLMSIDLKNRLEALTGSSLRNTAALDHPSIALLSAHLLETMGVLEAEVPPAPGSGAASRVERGAEV